MKKPARAGFFMNHSNSQRNLLLCPVFKSSA